MRHSKQNHLLTSLLQIGVVFFSAIFAVFPVYAGAVSETKTVSDDLDILIIKYPAEGSHLVLWLVPNFGFRPAHNDMARLLSRQNYEVWQADINEALFLPHNSTAMRELDPKYVSDLIHTAHVETGKKVVLVSGSYGAIPVLRGARQWQLTKPASRYLSGAILFSPNVYPSIPPLGTEPQFLPIAYATNIPVAVYQAEKDSNRWQVEKLADALRSGGSSAHIELMRDVVSLFHEEVRSAKTDHYFQAFAANMNSLVEFLEKHDYPLAAKPIATVADLAGTGLDSRLKPFKGNPRPHFIKLTDVNGKSYDISDFQKRVTVVNFWATWCTPCIKEIPSLNTLRHAMRDKPFELISINYAESPEAIKEFMKKVDVEFPVLIDEQGQESAKWKVIAFPSTFVIGRDGLIRYGVNAGIEWDAPEVLQLVNDLLNE